MPGLLQEPYPLEENPWRRLRRAALIGLFVGLFLLLFQPFGLQLWQTERKTLKILGFGVVTALITAVVYLTPAWVWPAQFREERWTVGREILLLNTNLLLIAVGNRLYLNTLLGADTHPLDWLGTVVVTYLVGLFPVGASVLGNYILRLKRFAARASAVPVSAPTTAPPAAELVLVAENEKDTVRVSPSDLLFVESADNYSTIVYWEGDKLARTLLRSSLSRLEGQVPPASGVVRCHRSFLVNLQQVEKVTGNAQGYRLHLAGGQVQVPVARRYNDSLIARLKAS